MKGVFKKYWHSSILSKLMAIIMLTVISALILTGFLLSINEYYVFRRLGTRSISTLSKVVGSNSIAALAFNDVKVASEILTALSMETEILVGCLYTTNKKLFATYIREDTKMNCPENLPAHGYTYRNKNLSLSEPIIRNNEVFGSFYIVSYMASFQKRLELYIYLLIGVIIGASLFAFWIASRLHPLVTGPILHLAETASFISKEGKYSLRAEESTEVEINILVKAFNRMLDAIQEREKKVVQSEAQFRAAFELAAVGNLLLAPSGQFMRVNSELCNMLEYSKEELLQMKFTDITHPDDLEGSFDVFHEMLHSKGDTYNFEKRYLTKNKSILWANVSTAAIHNQAGDVIMFISVIQNITEKKKVERERERLLQQERGARLEAEKSIQMRDDFLSIASHELRTPITPIKLHISLMKNQIKLLPPNLFPHQDKLIKAFDISERQIENLQKLIEVMLSVSRITSGQLILNRTKVDLSQIVRSVLDRFKNEEPRMEQQINVDLEEKVIGFWDGLKIEQAFINLFTNAVKYGAGNPIDITVRRVNTKAMAILQIRDYGIGITEANLNRIFDKFERVGSIKNVPGLGLGLYIAKEYVAAHGGTIKVESVLNKGSVFTIELPLDIAA